MNRKGFLFLSVCLAILWPGFTPWAIAGEAAKAKVILDTDIGGDIDDAWALGFV